MISSCSWQKKYFCYWKFDKFENAHHKTPSTGLGRGGGEGITLSKVRSYSVVCICDDHLVRGNNIVKPIIFFAESLVTHPLYVKLISYLLPSITDIVHSGKQRLRWLGSFQKKEKKEALLPRVLNRFSSSSVSHVRQLGSMTRKTVTSVSLFERRNFFC